MVGGLSKRDKFDDVRQGFFVAIGAILALYVARFVERLLSYLIGFAMFLLLLLVILLFDFGVL